MCITSKFAHLAQYKSSFWQSILNDPIQIALENHAMEWGMFAIETPLTVFTVADIVQVYEEPKKARTIRFADEEDDFEVVVVKKPKQLQQAPNPGQIKTVIVYNLPRTTTSNQLGQEFSKYGRVEDVYLPKNMDPSKGPVGSLKGFAMIRFTNAQMSSVAVASEKLRGQQIDFAKSDRK